MPILKIPSLLTQLLTRASDRFLDALARRISDKLRNYLVDQLQNCSQSESLASRSSITLEYPVRPQPRWGEAWNLRAHARLTEVIRSNDEHIRVALNMLVAHTESLRRIPVHTHPGSSEPAWVNGWLPGLDSASLYAFVAEYNPRIYIEVGSGNSTKFVRRAINDHGLRTRIISIDPHPRDEIDALCDEIIRQPLEDCDLSIFGQLSAGDMCFIDNSHRCFQNSDVTVVFLEILPDLASEVLIGFHDIFLPDDYPEAWSGRFYSEQYLLAAFLLGGHIGTEIVLPAWDACRRADLAAIVAPIWEGVDFAEVERHGNGFWLRTGA